MFDPNKQRLQDSWPSLTSFAMQGDPLDIRIKWPNDLHCLGKKVAGVLCHSTFRNGEFHVVTGVGLNLDNQTPTTCLNAVLKEQHRQQGTAASFQPLQREVRPAKSRH